MSALALAYFVNGDTGLKQTSEVNWDDVVVTAEELAAIVPIPENVLDDASIPIWDEVMPEVRTAMGKAIDAAVLFGTNIPTAWNTAIGGAGMAAVAVAKGNSVTIGDGADLYDDILGEDGLFSLVEQDGFGVTGSIAHMTMKGKLRSVRDANGNPIFNRDPAVAGAYMLDGSPIEFPTNGAPSSSYPLVSGDWNQLVWSMRKDLNWKVLTEAVIQDGAGDIVYNLAQQDMVALRVVMRLGFALPNPINRVNETAGTRFPFAVLASA
jgi:HK97 family phage major capsid protein